MSVFKYYRQMLEGFLNSGMSYVQLTSSAAYGGFKVKYEHRLRHTFLYHLKGDSMPSINYDHRQNEWHINRYYDDNSDNGGCSIIFTPHQRDHKDHGVWGVHRYDYLGSLHGYNVYLSYWSDTPYSPHQLLRRELKMIRSLQDSSCSNMAS